MNIDTSVVLAIYLYGYVISVGTFGKVGPASSLYPPAEPTSDTVGALIGITIGSKAWEPDNWATTFGRVFFGIGVGCIFLSCIIALTKVMP